VEGVAEVFGTLEDPRSGNAKRHLLLEILMIALCALVSGGESCADMALFGRAKERFLRQFLTLPHGIPSHDTFSRVFRLLEPSQFRACFTAFMQRFAAGGAGVVAIDGKTLRRSFDTAAAASPLHLVSVWACAQRLVLGQLAVESRSNEITAVPALLRMLALEGTIITADALHCQRTLAAQVVSQGGDGACPRAGRSRTRGSWRSRATRARCSTTCGSSWMTPARPWRAPARPTAAMVGSSAARPARATTSLGSRHGTVGRGFRRSAGSPPGARSSAAGPRARPATIS
jgi:hypothetical protein